MPESKYANITHGEMREHTLSRQLGHKSINESGHEHFMRENFITMHENEISIHENESFALTFSWVKIPCIKMCAAQIRFSCMKLAGRLTAAAGLTLSVHGEVSVVQEQRQRRRWPCSTSSRPKVMKAYSFRDQTTRKLSVMFQCEGKQKTSLLCDCK